jgi:hypothetical protein
MVWRSKNHEIDDSCMQINENVSYTPSPGTPLEIQVLETMFFLPIL